VACLPVLYSRHHCSLTRHADDVTRRYRMALSAGWSGNDREWRGALQSGMLIYFKSFLYDFTPLIGLYVHLLQI
jgi:hypothetical protein